MAKTKTPPSPEPRTPIKPTRKQLKALWEVVVSWRDENEVRCEESLLQMDSINEELPILGMKALDIVGYWKEEP